MPLRFFVTSIVSGLFDASSRPRRSILDFNAVEIPEVVDHVLQRRFDKLNRSGTVQRRSNLCICGFIALIA